jgi:hypothetical protein
VPVIRDLFAANDHRIETSDIVMLLTPRIVRTQEITADDLRPINVGTSQNMGISSQGSVFGGMSVTGQRPAAPATQTTPGAPAPGMPAQPVAAAPGVPAGSPVPPAGAVDRPVSDLRPVTPPTPPAGEPGPPVPPEPAPAAAQVLVSAAAMVPGATSSVPISIANASRVSQVTISVAYDPRLMRARSVSQGGFMAQGGQPVTFLPVIDAAAGRVDIVISRQGDPAGASGSGLLASIQFDPIATGEGTLSASGAATSPEGRTLPLTFIPATFRIR